MKRPKVVLPLRRKGMKGPEPCSCAYCVAAQPWRADFRATVRAELLRKPAFGKGSR